MSMKKMRMQKLELFLFVISLSTLLLLPSVLGENTLKVRDIESEVLANGNDISEENNTNIGSLHQSSARVSKVF